MARGIARSAVVGFAMLTIMSACGQEWFMAWFWGSLAVGVGTEIDWDKS